MRAKRSIVSVLIDVAVFILLEAAALSMLSHNGALQNMWLTRGAHAINAGIWGKGESVSRYFSLRKENEKLAQENFQLREQLLNYEQAVKDIQTGSSNVVKNFKYTPATIVKHSTNKQHNYLILDEGREDGVVTGSGVITKDGVIGVVDATSRHYSYVRSFNNKDMIISARIGRNGNIGALSWTASVHVRRFSRRCLTIPWWTEETLSTPADSLQSSLRISPSDWREARRSSEVHRMR